MESRFFDSSEYRAIAALGDEMRRRAGEDPTVLLRLKEDYDGAEPSAGSVTVANLLILAHLCGGDEAVDGSDRIERTLRRLGSSSREARAMPMMLAAASTYLAGVPQVIIVGARNAAGTIALHREFIRCFLPGAVSLVVEPGGHHAALVERLSWLGTMVATDGKPTAYLCRGFTCQEPTNDPELFRDQLVVLDRTAD